LRLFSFGGYGLALAALALVVFGAYDSYPFASYGVNGNLTHVQSEIIPIKFESRDFFAQNLTPNNRLQTACLDSCFDPNTKKTALVQFIKN